MSHEGALRMASALLATHEAAEVFLRLPGLAVSGSDAEQLGLATPQFQDVPLMPAAWRRLGSTSSLLVAGTAVAPLVASQAFGSAKCLFEAAVGVVVDGVLYGITKSEPFTLSGLPCGYRLSLQEPAWS